MSKPYKTDYCGIPGLYYFPNYLKDHDDVLSYVSQLPFEKRPGDCPKSFKYSTSMKLPRTIQSLMNIRNPRLTNSTMLERPIRKREFIDKKNAKHLLLLSKLAKLKHIFAFKYGYNDGVDYHMDDVCFGVVAGISLGKKTCNLKFKKGGIVIHAPLKPGSLYMMTGSSQYEWQHSIYNRNRYPRYVMLYAEGTLCKFR